MGGNFPDTGSAYYTGSTSRTAPKTPSHIWQMVFCTQFNSSVPYQDEQVRSEDMEKAIFLSQRLLTIAAKLPVFRRCLSIKPCMRPLLSQYHQAVMVTAAFIAGFLQENENISDSATITKVPHILEEAVRQKVFETFPGNLRCQEMLYEFKAMVENWKKFNQLEVPAKTIHCQPPNVHRPWTIVPQPGFCQPSAIPQPSALQQPTTVQQPYNLSCSTARIQSPKPEGRLPGIKISDLLGPPDSIVGSPFSVNYEAALLEKPIGLRRIRCAGYGLGSFGEAHDRRTPGRKKIRCNYVKETPPEDDNHKSIYDGFDSVRVGRKATTGSVVRLGDYEAPLTAFKYS